MTLPDVKKPEERRKEMLFRELSLTNGSIDVENRTAELSFSSDTPYKRFDWWNNRYYEEVLSHEPGAVDLVRLEQIGTVLFSHGQDFSYGDLPVASIRRVWVENGRGKAVVHFDEDEKSDLIFKKAQSGSLKGVSVGYRVNEWQITEPSDGALAREVATKWEPLEISIVAVPADASVGVGRSIPAGKKDISEGGTQMPEKVMEKEVRKEPEIDLDLAKSEGGRAERERVREIMATCKRFDLDADEYVDGGQSVEEFRAAVLENLAKKQSDSKVPGAHVEVDERDKFRSAALEGLAFRIGLKSEANAQKNDFSGMSLLMIADRCLTRNGDARRGDPMVWLSRAMSTSDFQYICGEIANKAVMEGWAEEPETWRDWCGTGSAPDFKTQTLIGIGAFGKLPRMKEREEYKFIERVEEHQTVKVVTFGAIHALSRETIINDDLGFFNDVLTEMGSAARRTVASLPYEVLTDNAKLADGKELFHTVSHKNTGTAGVIDVTSLNEGELLMSQQKDVGGKKNLGISPRFLIVPMALKGHVRQFFATQLIGGVANQPNIYNPWFQGAGLTPIFEHTLDDASPKTWYLAAQKGRTVKVYFLNGVQSPYLESRDGWNVDGVEWKVRIDAAAAAVDYRGLFRNDGPQG